MKNNLRNILFSRYGLLALAVFLFSISFLFNSYYTNVSSITSEKNKLDQFIENKEKDFQKFLKDTLLLRKLTLNTETIDEFKKIKAKEYAVFLYAESVFEQQQMLFWNTQQSYLPSKLDTFSVGENFVRVDNGFYVMVKQPFQLKGMSNKLWAYAMIPVKYVYYIESTYLPWTFAYDGKAIKKIDLSAQPTDYPIVGSSGKTLFYISHRQNIIPYNNTITVIMRLMALLLFFIFAHSLAESVAQDKKSEWPGVLTLATILFVFRISIYYFPSIFQFRQFELFDPSIYAGGTINKSLGDLLINSLMFSWITVFAWSKLGNRFQILENLNPTVKLIFGAIALLILVLSSFSLANVIRSLVADSEISFDVTNFFSLTKFTVIGFIVLASLSLGYYYFTQLIFRFIFLAFEKRAVVIYFGIAIVGLFYLSFHAGDKQLPFYIAIILWLMAYSWLVKQQGLVINRFNFNVAGVLFWILVFSVSISAVMLSENTDTEWNKRKQAAENIASRYNESTLSLLSMGVTVVDNHFLAANFHRFYNEEEGKFLRDSILHDAYPGYNSYYTTRFLVFDSLHNGLYNEDNTKEEALNNIISIQSKASEKIKDVYTYNSANKTTYITRRVVTNDKKKTIGTLFILSNPRKFGTNELEATIFREPHSDDITQSPVYSYAIYEKGSLKDFTPKYSFPIKLDSSQIPQEEIKKVKNGDYDELWYRDSSEKIIVLARKRESLIEAITLFSYIFCSFLFLVTLIQTLSLLLNVSLGRKNLKEIFEMNIRTQVHSTIIFVSLVSFLIIGAATISFFIARYKRNNEDRLSKTLKVMSTEMQKKIKGKSLVTDTSGMFLSSNAGLDTLVNDVSTVQDVPINVYELNGNLLTSSQKNIYTNGVLSTKMEPEAYYHLNRLKEISLVQNETINELQFLSIYGPVLDEQGNIPVYINIPYFQSQSELNQEISNFLVAIINLNAFIFLIAGVIALFITNRITRSFSIIGEKMRETSFGQNELIEWNRNDEISELVTEYNKMVIKLGESAAALAKSEREGAWREMARQVAHEIKNPLTPMKLSIQYLQKAILNNSPNVKELTANVANTLVEQIDHLSKIAFDFSQFANIGNTKVELFDMHDILRSLKELYHQDQQVEIQWNKMPGKAMLMADKTQMNRLFTNLFQNAVESCNGQDNCRIQVSETQENGSLTVSIKDNGQGIPADVQSKIFAPNFTTKSSGTGLGLAMCKGIVEQARGEIWFETKSGEGTVFHVKLPLAN